MTTSAPLSWVLVSGLVLAAPVAACSSSSSSDGDEAESASSNALTTGTPIISGVGSKCLDDSGDGTANGNKIQLYACNGTAAQAWTFTGGTFVGPGGKCLGIHGGVQETGTLVDLYQCNQTTGQQWSVSGTTVKSTLGLCLDVQGGVNANGTQVQVSTCNGTAAQVWTVSGATSAPDAGKGADASSGQAAPGAVSNLQMTGQGQDSISLTWGAATAGSASIAHYKIYRNGAALGTTTGTSYVDTTATNATTPGYAPASPATTYGYDVSAVDTAGREGPLESQLTAWVYNDGTFYWSADYDAPDVSVNYADTSGGPENGAHDVAVSVNGDEKWWQPYSGAPFLTTDPYIWCMEIGAFHYLTIDLKPTKPNQTWSINVISRLPPGDVFNSAQVILPGNFGPAPEVGKWATYKIPFLPASGSADGSSLQVGYGKFVGSIDGTTLTVTENVSGMNLQAGSWLTGAGLAPDTNIEGPAAGTGGPGVYTISPSQHVSSTTMSAQRTNMYKLGILDLSSNDTNLFYADKIGFTTH